MSSGFLDENQILQLRNGECVVYQHAAGGPMAQGENKFLLKLIQLTNGNTVLAYFHIPRGFGLPAALENGLKYELGQTLGEIRLFDAGKVARRESSNVFTTGEYNLSPFLAKSGKKLLESLTEEKILKFQQSEEFAKSKAPLGMFDNKPLVASPLAKTPASTSRLKAGK